MEVRSLENRSRRNNIRFDGQAQGQGEDWHGSERKIKTVIKEKLGTENVKIECAHKIGKEERDDPSQKRSIIAKFLNYKDKEKVLREKRYCKLLDERLYINDDISEEKIKIRKELFQKVKGPSKRKF